MPKITADGRRLQMIVCSATLHAFEVKKMAVRDRDDILIVLIALHFSGKTYVLPHLG